MTNRETVIKNDLVLHTEDTDITSGRQATVVTTRDGSSEVVVVTRDNSDVKKTRDGPTTSLAADLDSCFLQSMVGITEEQIVDQRRKQFQSRADLITRHAWLNMTSSRTSGTN